MMVPLYMQFSFFFFEILTQQQIYPMDEFDEQTVHPYDVFSFLESGECSNCFINLQLTNWSSRTRLSIVEYFDWNCEISYKKNLLNNKFPKDNFPFD